MTCMLRWLAHCLLLMSVLAMAGCSHRSTRGTLAGEPFDLRPVQKRSIDDAIAAGVKFLQKSQNADGSWGTGTVTYGNEVMSAVPGSHQAFSMAVTALSVMALREAGEKESHDRGLKFLTSNFDAKRSDPVLIYNIWAHIYAVQALSIEMRFSEDPAITSAVKWHLQKLKQYETFEGGWFYYDFHAQTQSPSMGPGSFCTAAGLVALWEAQKSGLAVEQRMIDRAQKRLLECRLPSGAFLYGNEYKYVPRLPANRIKGSIGRNQACNFALWLWGSETISLPQSKAGLDDFFVNHDFIQMGRKRPIPHESWYQTAGYYYYFGHYYAARIIERIGRPEASAYASQLAQTILPYQEAEGSWWDYPMWDYHKPYGTAFAIMSLLRCK